MNAAIRRYRKAEAELKAAETALNTAVMPYLAKAKDDEHRIMRIVQLMPRTYMGTRRMYEQILKLKVMPTLRKPRRSLDSNPKLTDK